MADEAKQFNSFVKELLTKNQFHPDNPADGGFVVAYKNHIARVSKALATHGSETVPLQQGLAIRNPGPPGTGKIINPLFPFGAPPAAVGGVTIFADIPPGSSGGIPAVDERRDVLKQDSLIKAKRFAELNLYTDRNTSLENSYEATQFDTRDGVEIEVPDLSKIFEVQNAGFDFGNGQRGYKGYKPNTQSRKFRDEERTRRERAISNDDAFFAEEELANGFVSESLFDSEGISDATNYLPFFIEDLRRPSGQKQRIYFRAFFKSLRETIAPQWAQENYFGRVDPVGVYTGTSRSIPLSFVVVAMSKQGFTTMWRKMNQLAKMFYPTFRNGVIVKSPVCRLRIGDVICDEAGTGLPGYFSAPLDLDYSEATWEISEWLGFDISRELGKAPQMITVSTTFQVIHDFNPQVDETGAFDTSAFRRIGALREQPVDIEDGGTEVVGD